MSHGETGLLAAEGRVEELAGCLGAVLSEPDLGRRLGEQGRRRVERLFDIKRCTRRLESLYDEVAVPGEAAQSPALLARARLR